MDRRKFIKNIAISGGGMAFGGAAYWRGKANRDDYRLTHYRRKIPGLPKELQNFSTVHITDPHLDEGSPAAQTFMRLVSLVRSNIEQLNLDPEKTILISTGDHTSNRDTASLKNGENFWNELDIRTRGYFVEKFSVLGNHDHTKDGEALGKVQDILAQRDFIEQKITELNEINDQMKQSIQYASKIQKALLPTEDTIKQHVADCFILYIPRDVVSGDFYWFSHIEGKLFLQLWTVPATAYPVPLGPLLVTPSSTRLSTKCRYTNLTRFSPNWITRLSRPSVTERGKLKSTTGMDMVVLVIDEETMTVQYAAAHNP
ncbi:twin-arginine translocation signal domain-containing protein, partial [Candidatus Gracilibacteria bacterium]|nr:twin-arginine translocation signal domain-containing protein [Candidatus Gracilibacteria bacterium]